MESHAKYAIISAGTGHWYPRGINRLRRSLIHHGFAGEILTWTDFPNDRYDKSCPYTIKAAAFDSAIEAGFTHILWCDASFWAINYVEPLFDIINHDGYYLLQSGYNAAQSCSDSCLNYFNVSRDEAELIPDSATGAIGINLSNPIAKQFIDDFRKAALDRVFHGSRHHAGQSADPRFLFHRQDQSAATIIAHKLGMKLHSFGEHVDYYPVKNDKCIFAIKGM